MRIPLPAGARNWLSSLAGRVPSVSEVRRIRAERDDLAGKCAAAAARLAAAELRAEHQARANVRLRAAADHARGERDRWKLSAVREQEKVRAAVRAAWDGTSVIEAVEAADVMPVA